MLPLEVSDRTFLIKIDDCCGTAFAFDRNGKQYLVTAKHLVEDLSGRCLISIWHNESWQPLTAELVGHGEVDVSVLAVSELLADPDMILEPAIGGWFIGQDAFIVGFPLGLRCPGFETPFPAPLLKRTAISGRLGNSVRDQYVLDGMSNPGFSGSPIYLKCNGEETYKVALILSSSLTTKEPVYGVSEHETGLTVQQESGFTVAYSIKEALDLIDANPIGRSLFD